MLSYDFLRLYINAFAIQAEMYRATLRARRDTAIAAAPGLVNSQPPSGPLFTNVAGAPDARFIYESIDAANSLISTLNSYIDPVSGLRYMPLKYYLYIIYAAVFLFKVCLLSRHAPLSLELLTGPRVQGTTSWRHQRRRRQQREESSIRDHRPSAKVVDESSWARIPIREAAVPAMAQTAGKETSCQGRFLGHGLGYEPRHAATAATGTKSTAERHAG
jgi:hypothetical protein